MNIITVAVFVLQSVVLLGALTILGYPLACLLRWLDRGRKPAVLVPVLGIYPLVQCCWLWSYFRDDGLEVLMPALLAVFATLDVLLLAIEVRANGTARIVRSIRSSTPLAWIATVVSVAYVVIHHPYFALDYVTPVTLGNRDISAIAVGAEHLRTAGFAAHGNVAGVELGHLISIDTFGTYALDLFPAALLGRPVWTMIPSTMLVAMLLTAFQLQLLLSRGMRVRTTLATLAALAATTTPIMWFIVGHGYMSQLFGISLFLAGVTVLLRFDRRSRRSVFAAMLTLGTVDAILWHVYPFVALLLPLFAVPLRVAAHRVRSWPVTALLCGVTVGCGFVLSAILAAGRFETGFAQARVQSAAQEGWKMGPIYPHELLGLSNRFVDATSSGLLRWSVALAAVATVAVLIGRRRTATRLAAVCLAGAVVSHALVYARSGVSYQQWKWAAFVAPLIAACFWVLCVNALNEVVRRVGRPRLSRLPGSIMVTTFGLVVASFVYSAHQMTDQRYSLDVKDSYITPELRDLSRSELIEAQSELGLRTSSADAMWITSFFPRTDMYNFRFFGYYPLVRANDLWVLESTADALPPTRVADRRPVDDGYQLVMQKPAGQADVEILDHPKSVAFGETISWRVRVTNRSDRTWSSDVDAPNHFTLVVSLLGKEFPEGDRYGLEARNGSEKIAAFVIDDRVAVQELPDGVDLRPGQSFVFEGALRNGQRHDFALQFDPKLSDTGAYELWTPASILDIDVP